MRNTVFYLAFVFGAAACSSAPEDTSSGAGAGGYSSTSPSSSAASGGSVDGDAGVDAEADGDGDAPDAEPCWHCDDMLTPSEPGQPAKTLADAAKLCAGSDALWSELYAAACNGVCLGVCQYPTPGESFCSALVHDAKCMACLANSPPNGEGQRFYQCKTDVGGDQ